MFDIHSLKAYIKTIAKKLKNGDDMKFRLFLTILFSMFFFGSCFSPNNDDNDVTAMILIEGGTFTMGDVWGDGHINEKPTHEVTLNDFYIAKYEVTQELYYNVMGNNPSEFMAGNYPAESISWYDALAFCNGLSDSAGFDRVYTISGTDVTADFSKNGYRLPTEAEWEYAARSGGEEDRKWSGTADSSALRDYAWYHDNSYTWVDTHAEGTKTVGTRLPNALGLYDMSGNVWEWCWDIFGTYPEFSVDNPKGASVGAERVIRGGGWTAKQEGCRNTNRLFRHPTWISGDQGFRVARNAE